MSGSANHEAWSKAGASLRYEEFDGGSEEVRGVTDEDPVVDNYGYIVVDGVRDRSWREPRSMKTPQDGLVSMSNKGVSDHVCAWQGRRSIFL